MDTKNTIIILEELAKSSKLSVQESAALNKACSILNGLKRNEEERYDFQGWPIEKLTMKDLREFVNKHQEIDDDVNILVLEDDGMGYGANNGYCSDISVFENEDGTKKEVQIWF